MAKKPETESILDMFSKFGSELKLPKVDVEAILGHHRKNLEALEKSARAAASGASSLIAKQREVLQETLREITDMAQSLPYAGQSAGIAVEAGRLCAPLFRSGCQERRRNR